MGAIIYDEFQCTPDTLVAALKAAILTSADWSNLPPTYEALSTFNNSPAAGSGSLSMAASVNTYLGEKLLLARGTANEEVVTVTSGNSTNANISVTTTTQPHTAGQTIERYLSDTVKSVTADGAELVIDVGYLAPTTQRVGMKVYRSHDGTTGVDEKIIYPRYMANSAGATTTLPLHVLVAAGEDFLFFTIAGPRAGESFAESAPGWMDSVFLGRILPYDPVDTSKPVLLSGRYTDSNVTLMPLAYVSRDAADVASWVPAHLGTITWPTSPPQSVAINLNPKRGSTRFLWPYVVSETTDGPRGRLKDVFYAGWQAAWPSYGSGQHDVAGKRIVKDGITYQAVYALRHSSYIGNAFGYADSQANVPGMGLLLWVPIAGTPA